MFTILHISDLHRSRDEPIDNDSLVAALLADSDRYLTEIPPIPPTGAIVVSGDIIQGAALGTANSSDILCDQYKVAKDFLNQLAIRFLEGDRSRIVIVPGNHDVCWNTSIDAMERIPDDKWPRDLRRALLEPDSTYRWSWGERALYRIRDQARYADRLRFYWDFIEEFYKDVTLPVSIDRDRGYQLFELNNRSIFVAAFDSIERNDCFSYSGAFARGAVARCNLHLRDCSHAYSLKMAVWHHSFQGPPPQEDYMDIEHLRAMVGFGFQLGMHGHQHVAETTTQRIYLDETQSMGVVCAGSLCAGARELPRGVNRQYNIVVLDEELRSARAYVREMTDGLQFVSKRNGAFLEGFARLSWQAQTDGMGRPINAAASNKRRNVMMAEEALRSGRPEEATRLLQGLEKSAGSHERKLAIQALQESANWKGLIDVIDVPTSVEESVFLVSAFINCGLWERAESTLSSAIDLDQATRGALLAEIHLKKAMRGA